MKRPTGKRPPELGRWWFCLRISYDYARRPETGWRRLDFAIIKLKSRPPDGDMITREYYRGFWIALNFWLPFEFAR